jgi:ABC-type Fe3+-siderophore transport system permease subunit
MVRINRNTVHQLAFTLLRAGAAAIFFSVVAHHVAASDFRPLAVFCLPVLAVFFGFTSLLYMRGRTLSRGRDQVRTLFAAERTMQGTVAYLSGVVLAASLYGLLEYLEIRFDPAHPTAAGLWLLLYLAPYSLMQTGFFLIMGGICVIAPQFMRPVSPYEVWRRVARAP